MTIYDWYKKIRQGLKGKKKINEIAKEFMK
ncbi:hypothetical protein AusDCA_1205 [Desulfitobacterium sp. AusDCA]